jgi:CRP-like cAMP-binding protein
MALQYTIRPAMNRSCGLKGASEASQIMSDNGSQTPRCERRMAPQNRLMLGLSEPARALMQTDMAVVPLSAGQVLAEVGDPLTEVYFPIDCIVFMMHELADGARVSVAGIGNEGMVDVSAIMGGRTAMWRTVVERSGYASRLPIEVLRQALAGNREIQAALLGYVRILLVQIGQVAVCHRHHCIEQQLCRFLLSSIDRMRSNILHLTHERIAALLGIRREGVTEALRGLKESGVIDGSRGVIAVRDRSGLERHSCECYEVMRQEYDRLRLPPTIAQP